MGYVVLFIKTHYTLLKALFHLKFRVYKFLTYFSTFVLYRKIKIFYSIQYYIFSIGYLESSHSTYLFLFFVCNTKVANAP